jgi:NADH-quinone oxidoreductase subunit M
MGLVAAFFIIAGLASLGLPGTSGFVAEFLVFAGAFKTYPVAGVLGIIAAMLTAAYILRLVAKVFFGPLEKTWEKLRDADPRERFAAGVLVAVLIIVGVMPAPLMKVIDSGVETLMERLSTGL